MSSDYRSIALIPARSGSKRIPDKNIHILKGHPLLAYAITAALKSEQFDAVVVATDSAHYAEIARHYGATVPFLREKEISGDTSPDIEWVSSLLGGLRERGEDYDIFSILRPTSPFRMPETIQRAMQQFLENPRCDSLRAVEKCSQHPGKMWVIREKQMFPLLPLSPEEQPWHSSQMASLPDVYVQNASLEIAWSRVVFEQKTIAGVSIMPFYTQDYEGVDLNKPYDLWYIEWLLSEGYAQLPAITKTPFG
ncbi:acylneuraminate cytidylyltransferase family protein [Magnetococcales bacterium HHB-1]